ncbi:MAG: maltose alpha-D-glucosyltransferase, partial [Acidobacteriaceae bacterium]|nr:maltose alpha-D-glucosyltransferase [Acidobacteriaceae bacterium]
SFLREAHRRGIRVITEVVVNHTSDQHPWFQRARRAPKGSPYRDFYVWSDNPNKYREARIIFKDFETSNWTFDHVAQAYFWHRFYSHQPDLNFDSPHVKEALFRVIDYWLDMGIDGFRLDAIPYLYEREGTNCENLPETHGFLKQLRAHIDAKYPGRMLLAEANQWPEDSIAYFGDGDECNMAFHFPLMPRLFMSIRMEDRYPITEILRQTPPIPTNCQWATFLRNHDELTLEMVTDEERDYMYRVYAHDRQMRINLGIRRRLAPLLGNDRKRIELMHGLLFSLPGTPVLYYGDEIGMGDNIYLGDRNGVRTPMQWSADRNAGFSRANPQKLYLPVTIDPEYHFEAVNVEAQQNNPNSLLWWTKHLIEQRKNFKAFGRGTLEFLNPDNRKVLAFIRRFENETILVVANLSRFPQAVALNLCEFKDLTPVEAFGRAAFPAISNTDYPLTLGAHDFFWFALEPRPIVAEAIHGFLRTKQLPIIHVDTLENVFTPETLEVLARLLPPFLTSRRWFLGKNRPIVDVDVIDGIAVTGISGYIVVAEVRYAEGEPELYTLPAAVATGAEIEQVRNRIGDAALITVRTPSGDEGVVYGALWNPAFRDALLTAVAKRRRIKGMSGEVAASHTRAFRKVWGPDHPRLESALQNTEQSNSSVTYGDRFVMKIFRRLEAGRNPELEMTEFLTARGFPNVAPLAGSLEYRRDSGDSMTLGILQGYVSHQGDAWQYTIDTLSRFFEQALAHPEGGNPARFQAGNPLDMLHEQVPPNAHDLIGTYIESARLLGQRTAEMHLALASEPDDAVFAPEPFTDHYRVGLFHGMVGKLTRTLDLLRRKLPGLERDTRESAQQVLARQEEIEAAFRPIRDQRFDAKRCRLHGDLHLAQVLYTGKDFVFVDFEGELSRPLGERRIKRSPLRDVAGMLRSFQYAAGAVLFGHIPGIGVRPESRAVLETQAHYWYSWVAALYLQAYLKTIQPAALLPRDERLVRTLLLAYMLERALDQLAGELTERQDWVMIPLQGILSLVGTPVAV